MQKSSDKLHQLYSIFGAMLLVSSTFVLPMGSSAPQTIPNLFAFASFPSGIPIPPPGAAFRGLFLAGDIPAAVFANPAGIFLVRQAAIESALNAPPENWLFGKDTPSNQMPSIFPSGAEPGGVEVSVENSFFGGQAVTVSASGSSVGGAQMKGGIDIQPSGAASSEPVQSLSGFNLGFFSTSSSSGAVVSTAQSASGQVLSGPTSQIFYLSSPSSSVQFPSTVPLASITSAIPGLWLDSSKRRSRSQIYVEILELMKRGPMTPFEIAFYARLNHKRTKQYVEFLKRGSYLEAVEEDGRLTYVLSKNGIVFLDKVKNLFENNQTTEYLNFDYSSR